MKIFSNAATTCTLALLGTAALAAPAPEWQLILFRRSGAGSGHGHGRGGGDGYGSLGSSGIGRPAGFSSNNPGAAPPRLNPYASSGSPGSPGPAGGPGTSPGAPPSAGSPSTPGAQSPGGSHLRHPGSSSPRVRVPTRGDQEFDFAMGEYKQRQWAWSLLTEAQRKASRS